MADKKQWKQDLLNLVLLLSSLRVDRSGDLHHLGAPLLQVGSDDARSYPVTRSRNIYDFQVSPKNYESMLSNYERWVFHDLNVLGRYSPVFEREEVTAYVGLTPDDRTDELSPQAVTYDDEYFSGDPSLSRDGPVAASVGPEATDDDLAVSVDISSRTYDPPRPSSIPESEDSLPLPSPYPDPLVSDDRSRQAPAEGPYDDGPSTSGLRLDSPFDYEDIDPNRVSFSLSELGSPRDWSREFPDADERPESTGSDPDLTREVRSLF